MRIIAGSLRGLVLKTFDADNIRPTLDRAREGIFNKIQFGIRDSYVLDLFGGTGAISLEFVSRGASKVLTCDNNTNSINLINQNFKKAKQIPNLYNLDYLQMLERFKNEKFDYIFLDPPFNSDFGEKSIDYICSHRMLKDDGIIIFEHSSDRRIGLPEKIEVLDTKKYGYITVEYLRLL